MTPIVPGSRIFFFYLNNNILDHVSEFATYIMRNYSRIYRPSLFSKYTGIHYINYVLHADCGAL